MTLPRYVISTLFALAVGVYLAGSTVSAQNTTAVGLYQRATDREAAMRATSTPAPDELRRTVAAYELVVRKFPKSGLCDNALWNAAGVALLHYQQTGTDAARADGERLLTWLGTEYPASPFSRQIDERRRAFETAPARSAPRTDANAKPAPMARADTGSAVLKSITRETLPGGDRIVIEVDREVAFKSDRIANPDRVFLDLASTTIADGVASAVSGVKGMMVSAVRLGRPNAATTRVVVDLAGSPKHSIYPLYGPYRLIIDAEGAVPPPLARTTFVEPSILPLTSPSNDSPAAVAATPSTHLMPPTPPAAPVVLPPTAGPSALPINLKSVAPSVTIPAPPSATGSGEYSLARQLGLGVQRVVIDAGHGGHDPGAHGNGIVEKDLVLDVALRVQKLLQGRPGVEVILTRSTDEFIALEERTAMANRAGADLFLSIHANASTRPDARGLETYFLNFATNPEAEAVAARENATSSQSMGHLPEILKAIALNAKLAESRELASLVQTSMVRRMKTQSSAVRDLGVKQAPFVVLIGAQMPSVLAEISFVTNKGDASLLKQSAGKQRIAQALFDAIVKYQGSLKRITTVASKAPQQ